MMPPEPDYEAALGLINHFSTDELKELVNNEEKLQELILDLPQLKNLGNEKEMLLTANKSLAEYNLSMDPKLLEGRQELISKYEELASLDEQNKNLKAQKEQSVSKLQPDTVKALLQTAAHEKEEESEQLVQLFFSNQRQVDDFIPEFVEKRSTAHLRKVKAEKVSEILSSNYNHYEPSPWSVPYPMTVPDIPMPPY